MILIRADTKPNTKWIFLKNLGLRAVIISNLSYLVLADLIKQSEKYEL